MCVPQLECHSAFLFITWGATLPLSLLVETARILARPGDQAVFGPAYDGGYYLLGVNAPHHRLFPAIAWSTEHVAHQTLERAAELHLPATAFYAVELATDTAPVSSQCNLRSMSVGRSNGRLLLQAD